MCIQVFYVRQGKLVERDATIFPFFNEAKDAFISFIGQFYQDQRNIKPKQILVPIGIDNNLLHGLLQIDVHTPFRGQKKELVNLAEKNAKIALEERFSLRSEEHTSELQSRGHLVCRLLLEKKKI